MFIYVYYDTKHIIYNFRCNNVLYIRSVDDENEGVDAEMKD